jgi:hypothetical protein
MTNFYLITIFDVYLQVLKKPIKPHQAQNIYVTKEQKLEGKVDWIFKDSKASDAMCVWWTSTEFRAISEQNRLNSKSKPSVYHYGADGHIHKTRSWVR